MLPARGQDASTNQTITIDCFAQGRPLKPLWAYFGYDEPNYTYMKDGTKLLSELAALSPVPVYVRCHNLLTSGDGIPALKWGSTNAYTEDARGRPVYDWHITDSIFDTYVHRGMKPLAEIGFMPEALSTHPQPYRHHWRPGVRYDSVYTGWAWPPLDYKKWEELVYQWVRHCVQRYGVKEVNSWLWEVWNEPNIGYWKGTQEDYIRLYDYAAAGVKKALSSARVGGPATTGPGGKSAAGWLRNFLSHCDTGMNAATGKRGVPIDFISYHAKGSPKIVNGHVQMNMAPQLTDVARGMEIVAASAFKDRPIYITECDPEGCAACGMATNPENAYRNGTMYSSYTAASFSRLYELADRYGVNLAGAISWSFEFENQKWFDGFRDLATNGVDKPVLNVFRMYGMMEGKRLRVAYEKEIPLDSLLRHSVHGDQPDVHALAALGQHSLSVMAWNYHDADSAGPEATGRIYFKNLPARKFRVMVYVIDDKHNNSYEVWKKMGSPQQPTDEQYKELERVGRLQPEMEASDVDLKDRSDWSLLLHVPRHAVQLWRLTW
jgi:xylan 1,4-beta-xylosidase